MRPSCEGVAASSGPAADLAPSACAPHRLEEPTLARQRDECGLVACIDREPRHHGIGTARTQVEGQRAVDRVDHDRALRYAFRRRARCCACLPRLRDARRESRASSGTSSASCAAVSAIVRAAFTALCASGLGTFGTRPSSADAIAAACAIAGASTRTKSFGPLGAVIPGACRTPGRRIPARRDATVSS